jgi:flagellar basal-body rod protein FlgF
LRAGGIGPGAEALRYWQRRQEVVSNNLANASTPGFKAERVFARLLQGAESPVATQGTDFSEGSIADTGRPLDLALNGDGFLVVQTDGGERYVRGGSFRLDESGALVTEDGHPVLGDGGALVLPPGQVSVQGDGTVQVDGAAVGRLRVERPRGTPTREGTSLWRTDGPGEQLPPERVDIRQGHLEESNVDPVSALVEMIEIQRAYGAIQRSIQASDGIMQTITSDIGRVQG